MNETKARPPRRLEDPDFRNAEIAMQRAAERARRRARRIGTEPVTVATVGKQAEGDTKTQEQG